MSELQQWVQTLVKIRNKWPLFYLHGSKFHIWKNAFAMSFSSWHQHIKWSTMVANVFFDILLQTTNINLKNTSCKKHNLMTYPLAPSKQQISHHVNIAMYSYILVSKLIDQTQVDKTCLFKWLTLKSSISMCNNLTILFQKQNEFHISWNTSSTSPFIFGNKINSSKSIWHACNTQSINTSRHSCMWKWSTLSSWQHTC